MAWELPGEGLTFTAAQGETELTLYHVTAGFHSSFSAEEDAQFTLVIKPMFTQDDEGQDITLVNTDLSAATLTNVDSISLEDGSVISLSMAQIADIGQENIVLSHPGDDGAVHVADLNGDLFDSTTFGEDVAVEITLAQGEVVLDPATDLTNVRKFVMKGDTEVTFTADQVMDLATSLVANSEGITDLEDLFAGVDTNTINITGLTQAHADWTIEWDGEEYTLLSFKAASAFQRVL